MEVEAVPSFKIQIERWGGKKCGTANFRLVKSTCHADDLTGTSFYLQRRIRRRFAVSRPVFWKMEEALVEYKL